MPFQCSLFLIKENGLIHGCNSSNATCLFQKDKFYDVSYGIGDKSIQCSRKVDVFKFWLMLKARGLNGFEQLVDNAIDKANYLFETITKRAGFRLVQKRIEYTNVCFWYIPKRMRGREETKAWWNELYTMVTTIKEKMYSDGTILIGSTPLPSKNIGNFFRISFSCFPVPTETSIDFLLDEIQRIAENL